MIRKICYENVVNMKFLIIFMTKASLKISCKIAIYIINTINLSITAPILLTILLLQYCYRVITNKLTFAIPQLGSITVWIRFFGFLLSLRASTTVVLKFMLFCYNKDLLYYFITSFYNIPFNRCFIIQFYELK